MTPHPVRPAKRRAAARRPSIALSLLAALGTLASACGSAGEERPPSSPPTEASTPPDAPTMEPTAAADSSAASTASASTASPGGAGAVETEAGTDLASAMARLAGAEEATLVEDWSAFGDVDAVEGAIGRNLGMGENALALRLVPAASPLAPGAQLELAYEIGAAAPHDFVGFDRSLDAPADWSGARAVALWVASEEATEVEVVFQFREASGEVWRHQGAMPAAAISSAGDGMVVLPFDPETFAWASWSREENGTIDLEDVDQYGVYVGHTGPGRSGAVRLGPIAVVR